MSLSPRKPLKKQNQHEIPENYLRAFCSPDSSFIWVFRRGSAYSPDERRRKGNPFRSGIHETAAKRNRYAGRRLDGTFDVDGWEQRLQRGEHAADGVLAKLRKKQMITASEKEVFTDYLLLMWRRVSKRWEDAEPRARAHVSRFDFDEASLAVARGGRVNISGEIRDTGKFLRSDAGIKNLLLSTMFEPLPQCRSAILSMDWRFVSAAPETYFVTSDAPFVFDEGRGLRGSPILFPMSPEVLLITRYHASPPPQFAPASPEEVLRFNAITMRAAHEEIYAPYPDEWIQRAFNFGVTFDPNGARINSPLR